MTWATSPGEAKLPVSNWENVYSHKNPAQVTKKIKGENTINCYVIVLKEEQRGI